MINWIKNRLVERTSLDGAALSGVRIVIILFGGLAQYAAYGAIAYGAWTLYKEE